jgi:hypothetical protein
VRYVGVAIDDDSEIKLKALASETIIKIEKQRLIEQQSLTPMSEEEAEDSVNVKLQGRKKQKRIEDIIPVDKVLIKDVYEETRIIEGIDDIATDVYNDLSFNELLSGSRYSCALKDIVLTRLIEPYSKLKLCTSMINKFDKFYTSDQIYRMMDKLYDQIDEVKKKVFNKTYASYGKNYISTFFYMIRFLMKGLNHYREFITFTPKELVIFDPVNYDEDYDEEYDEEYDENPDKKVLIGDIELSLSKYNKLCVDLMAASNLFGSKLGTKKLELIIQEYPDILLKRKEYTKEDLIKINGIAAITADAFLDNINNFYDLLDDIGISCKENKEKSNSKSPKEKEEIKKSKIPPNEQIVFTGFRNKDWEKLITQSGSKISSSISKNVSLVVANDINETSSKLQKARELNLKIISKDEFESKYIKL